MDRRILTLILTLLNASDFASGVWTIAGAAVRTRMNNTRATIQIRIMPVVYTMGTPREKPCD